MRGVGRVVARAGAMAALVLGLAGRGTPVDAQGVGAGIRIQGYGFEDPTAAGVEEVRMLTLPFAASADLGSSVSVGLSGAYARASATGPTGGEVVLSGPTDTELSLTYRPGPDWLMLSANAGLPTGRSSLSTRESFVAALVAAELLPFPIESWGSGGDAGAEVAVATQAGQWGVGLAAGYRIAREYEPIPDQPYTYGPGNQLQVRVAFDRDVSQSGTLSILLGLQDFSDDEIEGVNLFASGTRFQGMVSYAFPLGLRSSALVFGGVKHRSSGALLVDAPVLAGAGDSPSQQLFMTGTNLRIPVGRGSALLPSAEVSVFRAGDGASQGWVATLGPTLDLRIAGNSTTRQVFLSPSALLRLGHVVVQEGSETGFSGWEAGLALRVVAGR